MRPPQDVQGGRGHGDLAGSPVVSDRNFVVNTIDVPPDPSLLESMRSIGYTVESAVADVVDNSIAANAKSVDIQFSATGPFQISVVDDGFGMSRTEAVNAMRLAARGPSHERSADDLGRFGLGLKTASLSQCRTLTIITKKDGQLSALRWSLDHVITSGSWSLIELDQTDAKELLGWSQLEASPNGTLVHWGDLDQLAMTEGGLQHDLDRVAQRVRDHVALVFHRFSTGDDARKVLFKLNGGPIAPIDPFMSHSKLTQRSPWEPIDVEGHRVQLMAYTLPYLSRLSKADRQRALQLGGLRETQGFYVYRGARLVIWGTWFRVMPRSEMAKLTRVRVDIPNSLDHLWALDVKKSTAEPPPSVRRRLSELAKTMMLPSQRVQIFRGRKVTPTTPVEHMWSLRTNGDEFNYEVNLDHPTVRAFVGALPAETLKQFTLLLDDIQSTFPIVDAHNRMSGDGVPTAGTTDDDLVDRALAGWHLMAKTGAPQEAFITSIAVSEPYCMVPDFEKRLREALSS